MPFIPCGAIKTDPLGVGDEFKSGSSAARLAWKSSKCTSGRKSKSIDVLDPSCFVIWVAEPKLNVCTLSSGSCPAFLPFTALRTAGWDVKELESLSPACQYQ